MAQSNCQWTDVMFWCGWWWTVSYIMIKCVYFLNKTFNTEERKHTITLLPRWDRLCAKDNCAFARPFENDEVVGRELEVVEQPRRLNVDIDDSLLLVRPEYVYVDVLYTWSDNDVDDADNDDGCDVWECRQTFSVCCEFVESDVLSPWNIPTVEVVEFELVTWQLVDNDEEEEIVVVDKLTWLAVDKVSARWRASRSSLFLITIAGVIRVSGLILCSYSLIFCLLLITTEKYTYRL